MQADTSDAPLVTTDKVFDAIRWFFFSVGVIAAVVLASYLYHRGDPAQHGARSPAQIRCDLLKEKHDENR